MRHKLVGKLVLGVLACLFSLLALIFVFSTEGGDKLYHAYKAVVFALLALTSVVSYRYFED